MKTNVGFMSRWDFKGNLSNFDPGTSALISISDNIDEQREMEYLIEEYQSDTPWIALSFQDVDHRDGTGISNRQAHKLSQFIQDHEGCSFYVHCFAGVSRSAAVAKFINDYYDIQDPTLENYRIYNKMVLGKLEATLGRMSLEEYYRQLETERNT